MTRYPMTLAVVLGLALGLPSVHAQSVSPTTPASDDHATAGAAPVKKARIKARSLDQVQVSGSLINSAQIQTATPTYTITADDIKARGFNSVSEVLQNSVMASGTTQGPQSTGGFTQGSQTVSLYGLNPAVRPESGIRPDPDRWQAHLAVRSVVQRCQQLHQYLEYSDLDDRPHRHHPGWWLVDLRLGGDRRHHQYRHQTAYGRWRGL